MSSNMTPLSAAEVKQFEVEGWVMLREAFPRDTAERMAARAWERIDPDPHDRTTWTRRMAHLRENLEGPEIQEIYNPGVRAVIDQLLGAGRWIERTSTGWWPITFPGFDPTPWQPPTSGWHIDGIHFHHHLNSPEQGLLIIMLFSDMGPGAGGTCFRPGSHRVTARVLADAEPEGLTCGELSDRVNAHSFPDVMQVQGQAGDMAILHPLMSHAGSANCGEGPRLITNNCIQLCEPMRVDPAGRDSVSPVERAIIDAIDPTAAPATS